MVIQKARGTGNPAVTIAAMLTAFPPDQESVELGRIRKRDDQIRHRRSMRRDG